MIDHLRPIIGALVCGAAIVLTACGDDSPTGKSSAVGHLYFSQDGNLNGLYELDMTTGAATLVGIGETGTTSSTIGLTETASPAMLLGSIYADIAEIPTDGSGAVVKAGSASAEALAMDINTGVLYGAINGTFFTIDPTTGVSTGALTAPGTDIEGLAANPVNGAVFGLSRVTTSLYLYSVTGDSWSVVGNTGRGWLDTGLAYDDLAGVLYAIDATTDALYRINPATAATTLVGPLGVNAAGGLAFVVVK